MQPAHWSPVSTDLPILPTTLSELLGGKPCADWLRARHDALARSPAMVDRVAAVGVVARLWCPEDKATRAAVLAGSVEHPSNVAVEWLASLSADTRRTLHLFAFHRAANLRSALHEILTHGATAAPSDVLALLHERDALESVCALFPAAQRRSLALELRATDILVCSGPGFALPTATKFVNDPLLRAVFLTDPDAWWGMPTADQYRDAYTEEP